MKRDLKLGLRCNSGIDALFIQISRNSWLAKARSVRQRLLINSDKNFIETSQIPVKLVADLKKIALKTRLIRFYPNIKNPKGFQFVNEEKLLKSVLKGELKDFIDPLSLTISQKIFLYSIACDYDLKTPLPMNISEWKGHSFSVCALSLTHGTSQAKFGTFLGKSRQYINQKLKDGYNLKITNNFVTVSDSVLEKFKSLAHLKGRLSSMNLGAYRVDHTGRLKRQIPNSYSLKFDYIEFKIHKTYQYANQMLNKKLKDERLKTNNLESHMPAIKLISLSRKLKNRSKQKSNYSAQTFGDKMLKGEIRASKNIVSKLYTNTFSGVELKLYPKILKELNLLQKIDIPLLSALKIGARGEIDQLDYLRVISGTNFKQATENTFIKKIRFMNNFKSFTNEDVNKINKYKGLRKEQRLYLSFTNQASRQAAVM